MGCKGLFERRMKWVIYQVQKFGGEFKRGGMNLKEWYSSKIRANSTWKCNLEFQALRLEKAMDPGGRIWYQKTFQNGGRIFVVQ